MEEEIHRAPSFDGARRGVDVLAAASGTRAVAEWHANGQRLAPPARRRGSEEAAVASVRAGLRQG
jgi:hypothetical protein